MFILTKIYVAMSNLQVLSASLNRKMINQTSQPTLARFFIHINFYINLTENESEKVGSGSDGNYCIAFLKG